MKISPDFLFDWLYLQCLHALEQKINKLKSILIV